MLENAPPAPKLGHSAATLPLGVRQGYSPGPITLRKLLVPRPRAARGCSSEGSNSASILPMWFGRPPSIGGRLGAVGTGIIPAMEK